MNDTTLHDIIYPYFKHITFTQVFYNDFIKGVAAAK